MKVHYNIGDGKAACGATNVPRWALNTSQPHVTCKDERCCGTKVRNNHQTRRGGRFPSIRPEHMEWHWWSDD